MPWKSPQLIDIYQKLFGDLQSCYTCAYVSCLQATNNKNKNGGINYKGNGKCNGNFGASSKKAAGVAQQKQRTRVQLIFLALHYSRVFSLMMRGTGRLGQLRTMKSP